MSLLEKFLDLPFEEVIGDRFGRYSKYIIQDRALPDVRDGLKPVQRRILYAMYREGNTYDKPFRKSAKTVGTVIGNYHPHGDTSVYDAMVRMSQDWKVRNVLVDMHGNNGSIDGDPQAAMRYTEARLSKIASELLRDIDKQTVDFIPNFDDSDQEPTVLPARFPNLLVNGSTGISAGYATEIPPHHLGEVIDAVLMKLDNPEVSVEELMTVLKGPDFPTGGIIQGREGIKQAYETGKGKIILRARTDIEQLKGGREQIVITEIPYDVVKANLVRKIDELRFERKVEGIAEVRDETDRNGLRIVIELRRGADAEGILNYLFKNTDLQITYNFNMVAISNKAPKLHTLPQLLQAYIEHQKEVVERRSRFELARAEERRHVVEGLIYALSILDELITTIRASKDKGHAKQNIMNKFSFTEKQAEAIVTLQLYRLTNTDVTQLEKEAKQLSKTIKYLQSILNSEANLKKVIREELEEIKQRYITERRSTIQEKVEEITIDIAVTVPVENVIVTVTRDGYLKRTSLRSYAASNPEEFGKKEDDQLIYQQEVNTTDTLLLFTQQGNYIYLPVHELPDIRWKDMGQHIANLIPLGQDERIIVAHTVKDFTDQDKYVLSITKAGMVKKSPLVEYAVSRYSRPLIAHRIRDDDQVIQACLTDGKQDVLLLTHQSYLLCFPEEEISSMGQKALGVKGINLRENDYVVFGAAIFPEVHGELVITPHRGLSRNFKLSTLEKTARARRGKKLLQEAKIDPLRVVSAKLNMHTDST